jgi:hypothetical protein
LISAFTLVGLQDKGASAKNTIDLGRRPSESPRPSRSRWAAEDIIPALNQRVADLETQLVSMEADLGTEQKRLASYAESDESLRSAVREAYRQAHAIQSRARAEADALMEHALSERRLLVNEVGRLRRERDDLREEIASLRREGLAAVPPPTLSEAPPVFDQPTAVMEAMRSMLLEVLDEMRSRAIAPATVEAAVRIEIQEPVRHSAPQLPHLDADVALAPPLASEPTVEDVDDLARLGTALPPAVLPPEELGATAPSAPAEPLRDDSVELSAQHALEPTVEDIDDFARPEPATSSAPAAPAEPIIEESVEELRAPEIPPSLKTWSDADVSSDVLPEPFVEEIDALDRPEAATPAIEPDIGHLPSLGEVDSHLSPAQESDLVDELLANVTRPETPTEEADLIIDSDSADLRQDEFSMPPTREAAVTPPDPVPPVADAGITALWDAALPVSEPIAEVAPDQEAPIVEPEAEAQAPSEPEPTSFSTNELAAEGRAVPMPEAPYEFPQASTLPPAAESAATEPPTTEPLGAQPAITPQPAIRQVQLVISPVHSFPKLLEIERRIRSLASVHALGLRDFRNGVATFAVGVSEAITPRELGAVIQMLESMRLRLEGTSQSSLEMRVVEDPPGS